jgi:hypothetical protein
MRFRRFIRFLYSLIFTTVVVFIVDFLYRLRFGVSFNTASIWAYAGLGFLLVIVSAAINSLIARHQRTEHRKLDDKK